MIDTDMISRRAALEALEELSANYANQGARNWYPHIEEVKDVIRKAPPAQPEKGKTDD